MDTRLYIYMLKGKLDTTVPLPLPFRTTDVISETRRVPLMYLEKLMKVSLMPIEHPKHNEPILTPVNYDKVNMNIPDIKRQYELHVTPGHTKLTTTYAKEYICRLRFYKFDQICDHFLKINLQ